MITSKFKKLLKISKINLQIYNPAKSKHKHKHKKNKSPWPKRLEIDLKKKKPPKSNRVKLIKVLQHNG